MNRKISLVCLVSCYIFFFSFFLFALVLQPHVDFGLKLLGADAMSIPGLYRFVQVVLQFPFSDLISWDIVELNKSGEICELH